MARVVRRLTAEIVIETEPQDLERMMPWVISRFKSSIDFSNRGMVAIVVFDEEGKMVGQNMVGEPTTLSPSEVFDEAG
jgi:hypothetical protein